MEKIPQEFMMSEGFNLSINREELLVKKYSEYYKVLNNKEFKDMMKEFKKTSQEHIKLLKDKMIKLNIQE